MNNTVVNNDLATQRESITDLLGQLLSNLGSVVHNETELAIQGIREKMSAVRGGVLMIVTGAAISLVAFMSLCAALIIELTSYTTPAIAALGTGAALALIGVVIAFMGYKQLKKSVLKE